MQRLKTSYSNAKDILPPGLLRQLQEHFQGGLLWVPPLKPGAARARYLEARNRRIAADRRRGKSIAALGAAYGLTAERIRQIVRGG